MRYHADDLLTKEVLAPRSHISAFPLIEGLGYRTNKPVAEHELIYSHRRMICNEHDTVFWTLFCSCNT